MVCFAKEEAIMKSRVFGAFTFFVLWTSVASSAPSDCTLWNVVNTFESEFSVAKVKPDIEKLNFVKPVRTNTEALDCPSLDPTCQLPSFLVSGDTAIVTQSNEVRPFVCAIFMSPKGVATTAYLDSRKLNFVKEAAKINSPAGYGKWVAASVNATLTVRPGGDGFVIVEGEAYTNGSSPNFGTIGGAAFSFDSRAGYSDIQYSGGEKPSEYVPTTDGCLIRMRLIGPYLLVEDNNRCGGHNVTFSSLYAKTK